MFGEAVNSEIIPATKYIFAEMSMLLPQNKKRVSILTTLAHACTDCQQVQAREIMRVFGDLTAQNETFEVQLKYSLVRMKEASLDEYITLNHPNCDLDHTKTQPHFQRPHLKSGYIVMIGRDFGLDGLTSAKHDRFLARVQTHIKHTDKRDMLKKLKTNMSVKEWLQTLLADINNQNLAADRLINPACVYRWADANLSQDDVHKVFYDENRAEEFEDLEPKAPTNENKFKVFLSCKFLVDMLMRMEMLQKKPSSAAASRPDSMSGSATNRRWCKNKQPPHE